MLHVSSVQLTGTESVVMETSKGRITLSFFPADAPNTVANFVELAESGFYNGVKFHRVIPGFVAQGGDPQTRDFSGDDVRSTVARQGRGVSQPGDPHLGTGGPGWTQKAEFNGNRHLTGTLSMARSRDVDSAGSQFYICLAPQPSLDGQYTVFGQVTDGLDVVQSLGIGDEIISLTIVR